MTASSSMKAIIRILPLHLGQMSGSVFENKDKNKTEVFLSDKFASQLYDQVKIYPYAQVEKLYLDKDTLLDDKKYEDDEMRREPKRDKLLQQLFSIQLIIQLY